MVDVYQTLGKVAWTHVACVVIKGEPKAQALTGAVTDEATASEIVYSWQQIAVLKVTPAAAPFYVGFQTMDGSSMQMLPKPVETKDGLFGLRIGDGDVRYFVIPVDPTVTLQLELRVRVKSDDPSYADLPLY